MLQHGVPRQKAAWIIQHAYIVAPQLAIKIGGELQLPGTQAVEIGEDIGGAR